MMNHRRKYKIENDSLLELMSSLVAFRDSETGSHVKRIRDLTEIMARTYRRCFPSCQLSEQTTQEIVKAAAIHDIGKIAIPDKILLKPARLDEQERRIMQTHTIRGCELLKQFRALQNPTQYRIAYEICRSHHERFDGKGYPDGLKEQEIPLSAGLVSVVDAYDALVSKRVYKKAFDPDTAYHMILDGACGAFAPELLHCFARAREQLEAYCLCTMPSQSPTA